MIKKNIIVENLNITYYQSSTFHPDGALVFLHGWQSQALHLKSIFEKLDNYIAIDLPGFGLSEKPSGVWGATEYAQLVSSLLNKLGITSSLLIGHSFGGSVIIKYLSNGGEAKKIILIDASGVRIKTAKKSILKSVAKTGKVFTLLLPNIFASKIKKLFYSAINSSDYLEAGDLKESYQKIISEDLQADMRKIETPATLIWGANDNDVPLEYAQIIQNNITDSKLFEIADAGHFPFIDQPQAFNKIFMSEINVN